MSSPDNAPGTRSYPWFAAVADWSKPCPAQRKNTLKLSSRRKRSLPLGPGSNLDYTFFYKARI